MFSRCALFLTTFEKTVKCLNHIQSLTFAKIIVNRRDGLETHRNMNVTHHLCYCSGLCGKKVLHRHVRIVFSPN